jgi:signal transduction histidine kinase
LPAESEGRLIYELGNRQWDIPKLHKLLEFILPGKIVFNDFEVTHEFESIGHRTMLLNARKLDAAERQPARILIGIHDITERKWMESEIANAVEAEQRRLGQELHDGLAQELTGIGMMLDALGMKLRKPSPAGAEETQRLRRMLEKARNTAVSLAHGFYPVELKGHGLLVALQDLAIRNQERFGVPCALEVDKNAPAQLNDTRAIQLFRIAQEAIHNATKHGKAKHIHIRLTMQDDAWMLTVKDDGVGLKGDPKDTSGMGMRIMHHRAQMLGGTLELRNDDGGGVIVSCTVPAGTIPE